MNAFIAQKDDDPPPLWIRIISVILNVVTVPLGRWLKRRSGEQ